MTTNVPFVVFTIQSFTHSLLITGFVTRKPRMMTLVEREQLTSFGGIRVAPLDYFFPLYCAVIYGF